MTLNIDWSVPWLAPYRGAGEAIDESWRAGAPVAEALNAALARQRGIDGAPASAGGITALQRFVPQGDLPDGTAYESHIARTGCVPTRDNAHDLFNGLVWLAFPALKGRLNALHATQIERDGVGAQRGAARDALTLFDENAALWQAPPVLVEALRRRDWAALFVTHRALWSECKLTLIGHALLEKLLQPRKGITAHVWVMTPGTDLSAVPDAVLRTRRGWLALPVLGVPGWWNPNGQIGFYDDASVFRVAAATLENQGAGATTAPTTR
ncbi:MAG: hypothetical protein B7Y51_11360 [Burkholderiales bacterium 28-67-8]|nr:MAG: hypothetical protein B7Y51_11360 [Burkholderiales bacterium 28-67-8]